ncbi:transcriptional regulator [Oricola sp.]|uniref:transcriptional regulator n=1 Tax=Oricola sp. TaxID=1979950 RepID=UPI003BAAAFBF
MRGFALAVSIAAGVALAPNNAATAELVMFEQAGCAWCARWDREIGETYPKTAEGKRAPLRRVDINTPLPNDLSEIRVDRFTPTFVLVDDGREIARMRGYPGDEFFWFLLNDMFAKLNPLPAGEG